MIDPFFLLFIAFIILWWKVENNSPEKLEKLDKFTRENIRIIFDNTNLLQQQNNQQDDHHNQLREIVQKIKDEDVKILNLIKTLGEESIIIDNRSKNAYLADLKLLSYIMSIFQKTKLVELKGSEEEVAKMILEIYKQINPDAKNLLEIEPKENESKN